MIKSDYLVLGLMSGTSLDGVDLALCHFRLSGSRWNFSIEAATTLPDPDHLKSGLRSCIEMSRKEIGVLDENLGKFFAESIINFQSVHTKIPDLIASHGHTVLHQPEKGITLQIGNGKIMADATGITVINDFRSQDVALGGEGAPLVPIGDRDLFGDYPMCLNLGGFANISYNNREDGKRVACDIAPCNMALNMLTERTGKPFDENGELARKGKIDKELLNSLNGLKYYSKLPPKSLGKEWFLKEFLPLIMEVNRPVADLLRTVTEHIALQVASQINRQEIDHATKVLTTGGGAWNTFLMELIQNNCRAQLVIPEKNIVDYKEALVFGYLGILKMLDEINVLASVTGASTDSSSGTIHKPKK